MIINNYLYEGANEFFNNEMYKSHFVSDCLDLKIYNNAILLPFKILEDGKWGGGIRTQEGRFLPNSGVHNDSTVNYECNEELVEVDSREIVYLGMFNGVWGHNITDDLRRMWVLLDSKYSDMIKKTTFAYIPVDGFRFSDNFLRLLKCFGLSDENLLAIQKPTKFDKVYVPDECFYKRESDVRYFTKEYRAVISHIKNYIYEQAPQVVTYEKIYFTYSKYKKNVSYGESFLEKFFSDLGYEIIAPEDYTFEQQVMLLKDCKSLVSTVGSCSHNCIFLNDGAELILIPRTYCLTGYQIALNEVNELTVTWIDSGLSNHVQRAYPYMGPYCLAITGNLLKHFYDRGTTLNFSTVDYRDMLKAYCLYDTKCLYKYRKSAITAPEYYEVAVQDEISWIKTRGKISNIGYMSMRAAAFLQNIINRLKKFKLNRKNKGIKYGSI